ncbi:MAG TPA: bifunctional phosphoribosylaminoimidazolecarboxamide formyltransferase/IMP cyclohydrolase [Thermoanaerobaculia bacterium]|nr:bifunctional phosphoribosylaminoimidazolecarboxamide formyltransferase/IMP cyclohydrolase [Thermoanaerobaculia bacterium]
MLPAHRALVSVSDKSGLPELAHGLQSLGIEIVSTGGTLAFLRQLGVPAVAVADVTGFPEILDGRVKTLHPRIHAGILANRSQPSHDEQLATHRIDRIDLVIVNLYPFRKTAADPDASFDEVVEQIDIGGPAMVRAAAKNFRGVAVVVDPADYTPLLAALSANDGVVPEPLRHALAVKAFRHTHDYDGAVADWLGRHAAAAATPTGTAAPTAPADIAFPARLTLELERTGELRYGENPHQSGAVYGVTGATEPAGAGAPAASPALAAFAAAGGPLGGYRQLGGKELSWNNLLDADAARKMAALFAEPAVVIVKHNNPCGIGRGADLTAAYHRALATDPVSAFGSVIAVNGTVDGRLAAALAELFVEVLLAPGFDDEARRHFAAKKNLRLVECPPYRPAAGEIELRAVSGGFLAQPPDAFPDDPAGWTSPTRRAPAAEERRALDFAWVVSRYVKSNAIVIANADQTVGIGAGQMSRVDSCRIAIQKAQLPVAGTVAASDAYFPFRDGLDTLAAAGVTAVVQPGGSKRDAEVIAAADEHRMAMLLTGTRHFRH